MPTARVALADSTAGTRHVHAKVGGGKTTHTHDDVTPGHKHKGLLGYKPSNVTVNAGAGGDVSFDEGTALLALNLDWIGVCSHHPAAADPDQARCWCRKPAPGGVIEAATRLSQTHRERYPPHMGLMVGDRPEDQECARIASLDFMWAADWRRTGWG